jgi:hypothetical protein
MDLTTPGAIFQEDTLSVLQRIGLYTFDWHAIAGLAAGRTGPYEFASGTACPIPAAHGHGRGNRGCRKANTD